MTTSASEILNHYIDEASRFTIYSIEMERGENIEDLYYLCNVKGSWYVIYETDYFAPLAHIVRETTELFGSDVQPRHWLAKKAEGDSTLPLDVIEDKITKSKLILELEGTYLRYAVLAVDVAWQDEKRHDPTAYGYTS